MPSTTTLVVKAPSGDEQSSTRYLVADNGSGAIIETTFSFRPAGMYLDALGVTVRANGLSDLENFVSAEPNMLLPIGAKPGYHTSMTLHSKDSSAVLNILIEGSRSAEMAGSTVQTLSGQLTAEFSGDIHGSMTSQENVIPSSGMITGEQMAMSASAGLFQARLDEQSMLTSISSNS